MIDSIQEMLSQALQTGSFAVYALVFLGGVLASFTPCTYPVLPLTVGYIGNAAAGRRSRGFLLSLALVLGLAVVYAIVGVVFAALGLQMGLIWGNGWAVFAIAWFFILMSLMLVDVLPFPVPKFLQKLRAKTGGPQGIGGAFLVGGVSGLVVGPCTGPILGVVLVAVAATLEQASGFAFAVQVLDGGFKLFLFGLGQGALILLCGTFAGLLSRLPKSGQWMVTLRKGFALLILAGASLLLVYVGQATDFPNLTQLLAQAEDQPAAGTAESAAESPNQDRFGGEQFLD